MCALHQSVQLAVSFFIRWTALNNCMTNFARALCYGALSEQLWWAGFRCIHFSVPHVARKHGLVSALGPCLTVVSLTFSMLAQGGWGFVVSMFGRVLFVFELRGETASVACSLPHKHTCLTILFADCSLCG